MVINVIRIAMHRLWNCDKEFWGGPRRRSVLSFCRIIIPLVPQNRPLLLDDQKESLIFISPSAKLWVAKLQSHQSLLVSNYAKQDHLIRDLHSEAVVQFSKMGFPFRAVEWDESFVCSWNVMRGLRTQKTFLFVFILSIEFPNKFS
jgi:hypothetical protein